MTLAALVAMSVVACSSDDTQSSSTTSGPSTSASDEPPGGDAAIINVEAVDYAYVGVPATVAARSKFMLSNSSETELHEMVFFRLSDDETRSAAELMQLPEAELGAVLNTMPAGVLLAMPGSDEAIPALGDGTISEPGRYLVICSIPTGADPGEYMAAASTSDGAPEVAGGPPHFVNGMFAEFTVE